MGLSDASILHAVNDTIIEAETCRHNTYNTCCTQPTGNTARANRHVFRASVTTLCLIVCPRQELVRPRGEIVDLKSDLTGISMDDLEGVSTRQRDVTARLAPLLSPETILVGHSLHADLRALQLDHQPVIDTSMLFSYRCQPYG